jgi:hypothetical protein
MNYSNVIICPVGDTFGTAKSHAHAQYQNYGYDEDDYDLSGYDFMYKEVTPEVWVRWALNARSLYVSGDTGAFGNHTLWRSEIPVYDISIFGHFAAVKNTSGTEAPATVLSDATEPRIKLKVKGLLPFVALPWILGSRFMPPSTTPPVNGVQTPFWHPNYYILDGKFYISSAGNGRLEVGMNSMTTYRTNPGSTTEYSLNSRILTTFY